MYVFLRALLITFSASVSLASASSFDNNFEINDIDLASENFLDLKAHRFRKSLEYQWYDNTSGWRISAASLDKELAFVQTELKLQNALSEYVNVRLTAEQEVFYATEEFPSLKPEVEIYPWAGNFGFSLVAVPAYQKRDMDLGVAVIWGKRPWDFIRFEYLEVDSLYNQKNVSDKTFYSKEPKILKLEGAYQIDGDSGKRYKLRFGVSQNTQRELIDPENSAVFQHQGSDYFLLLDYQPNPSEVLGVSITGFTLDKLNNQTDESQQQATDYFSADIYWAQGLAKRYELRVGIQYDQFNNDIRDFVMSNNNRNYFMNSTQIYGTAYHRFNEHMAWDLGLYVAQVEEQLNFLIDNAKDAESEDTEIKFRMGFEYSSSDGRNSLQLNASLNVDGFFKNIGDGAGISYQSAF